MAVRGRRWTPESYVPYYWSLGIGAYLPVLLDLAVLISQEPNVRFPWFLKWIMSYPINPLELPDVSINMVFMEHKRFIISSKLLLFKIQSNVSSIGKDSLGFGPVHVGTHSNQSAAVTVMYFARVPVYTIILVRWWSSDALLYICCQVLEFSNGAAARMIANEQFFPAPDFIHHMVLRHKNRKQQQLSNDISF